jgi:hypothetical protein
VYLWWHVVFLWHSRTAPFHPSDHPSLLARVREQVPLSRAARGNDFSQNSVAKCLDIHVCLQEYRGIPSQFSSLCKNLEECRIKGESDSEEAQVRRGRTIAKASELASSDPSGQWTHLDIRATRRNYSDSGPQRTTGSPSLTPKP